MLSDSILLRGLHESSGSEGTQLQLLDRLIGQLCLKLRVQHRDTDRIILQLVDDIEGSVIATVVEEIAVTAPYPHRTRGIECVAEGVDIKVADISTIVRVKGTSISPRHLLITIGAGGIEVQSQLIGKLVAKVKVRSIPLHLISDGPTRVIEEGERPIEMSLIRTAGDTHGVILLDSVTEEL